MLRIIKITYITSAFQNYLSQITTFSIPAIVCRTSASISKKKCRQIKISFRITNQSENLCHTFHSKPSQILNFRKDTKQRQTSSKAHLEKGPNVPKIPQNHHTHANASLLHTAFHQTEATRQPLTCPNRRAKNCSYQHFLRNVLEAPKKTEFLLLNKKDLESRLHREKHKRALAYRDVW